MSEQIRVLFSCPGSTDPVRGFRDGGIMHIMRHYRPQVVCLFLSAEMEKKEIEDGRYTKSIEYVKAHWQDYAPKLELIKSGIENPHDLDTVYEPLVEGFRKFASEYADCQILINLSSGTPQMQMVMTQLALDVQYNALGIQVNSPEKRSGTTERTTVKGYAVDEELECNDDEKPDEPNRCTEPQMLPLQRRQRREQMIALLDRRDYRALNDMRDLPAKLRPLIGHLAARSDLMRDDKLERDAQKDLPFKLYPVKGGASKEYREISEYYLLLRNLHMTQRYSEFVLRINPFLVQLLMKLLDRNLPCRLNDILDSKKGLSTTRMQECIPDIKLALERKMNSLLKDEKNVSLKVCINLMWVLWHEDKEHEYYTGLLCACDNLNTNQRNTAAHQLHAVTEEQIYNDCVDENGRHYTAQQLVNAFGSLLQQAYPDTCDKELFTVYDRCSDYIRAML